jgi:hypothetical protein
MLYIENIDDCTFRLYGDHTSQAGLKVMSKMGMGAKGQEPAYNESTGRVSIYNFQKDEKILNHKKVSNIRLDGVIYATAQSFVNAFNNLMAECCCGSGGGSTTEIIDWLETISVQIASLIRCNCRDCNEIGMGAVDNTTKAFAANTLNSITIIIESGTVNISNGTENVDLIEGESVTYTAASVISNEITIDATGSGNKAVYATITCADTTTTTTIEVSTTTTTVCEDPQLIQTSRPDTIWEFNSQTGGGPN